MCGYEFLPYREKVHDNKEFSLENSRLIVINEISQISWKKLDIAKFRKLQEAIWLTLINEIFKFPPHFSPFGYENYLDEFSLG